ncbi:MAG: DUF6436 domain-containing protein [Colwellia polaris]|uniref:DUF6436 domain-containing protein n=1 Tax=Colwellia polaris TaxID=326537 RepID=UPI000A16D56F|nr:DUF6436 domain-containing protein [Colwellia polaris]
MPALNKSITPIQIAVFVIWIVLTLAAFAYFIDSKLVNFNDGTKITYLDPQKLSASLTQYIEPSSRSSILHFNQANCQCQQYSEAHIKDINDIATANNFNVKHISLEDHTILPATPSVAILNSLGEVVYYGPYGEGLACSQTSGFAQTMLSNFIKGYSADLIIKEAQGCYCKV